MIGIEYLQGGSAFAKETFWEDETFVHVRTRNGSHIDHDYRAPVIGTHAPRKNV